MNKNFTVPFQTPLALRKFSQNFLQDEAWLEKITDSVGITSDDNTLVIEVGPGMGSLTKTLLKRGFHVHAIEIDERFKPFLEKLHASFPDRFTFQWADVLKLTQEDLLGQRARGKSFHVYKLVSNVPYHISSPLILYLLSFMPTPFDGLSLLLQKEMAQRLAAPPGCKAYGRLSVLAQLLAHVTFLGVIEAEFFTPKPDVDSALVHIQMKKIFLAQDLFLRFQKIVFSAFTQRRKMLRSSLKGFGFDFRHFNIKETDRAEALTPDQFLALAQKGGVIL